ncbi:MAG: Asparagine synthetase (glutamine-hydrolyzing) 1 [bacterium ADurb.Bin374]|nr:MAG: Asparagine synthetase (glutamine-hydrolyzing) 1 [bacterium ADurb.Bin374]
MCGIAGIIDARNAGIDPAVGRRMLRRIRHRGDDGRGELLLPHAWLGHQRLAIIDLSDHAAQPFSSPDGRFHLVFNGEIYNYRELRAELEAEAPLRSRSDTEVLLRMWQRHGMSCLPRIRGMFAFAVWDSVERVLTLVRDRLGIKPLYYAWTNGILGFASELKAVRVLPGCRDDLDARAISDLLAVGYVGGEKSFFRQIHRLEPGCWLRLEVPSASLRTGSWWDATDLLAGPCSPAGDEEIRELLRRAVERRLVADVEIGCLLSGGIDSSAVLDMAVRQYPHMRTFSAGFPEADFDERVRAETFGHSRGVGVEGVEILPPTMSELRRLAWHFDQPFADSSAWPTWKVCELASKRVKVALTGDGGDEMFGGYETCRADLLAMLGRRFVPGWAFLLRAADRLGSIVPIGYGKVSLEYKARQFCRWAGADAAFSHFGWRALFESRLRSELLAPEVARELGEYTPFDRFRAFYEQCDGLDEQRRHFYVDLRTWLADDILVKADIASMAHGLELRSPFLDLDVVARGASVPWRQKFDLKSTKKILRRSLRGVLPDELIDRPKSGFNSPVSSWLTGPLRDEFMATVRSSLFRTWFPDTARIMALHRELEERRRDWGFALWGLFMFGVWAEVHLGWAGDGPPAG